MTSRSKTEHGQQWRLPLIPTYLGRGNLQIYSRLLESRLRVVNWNWKKVIFKIWIVCKHLLLNDTSGRRGRNSTCRNVSKGISNRVYNSKCASGTMPTASIPMQYAYSHQTPDRIYVCTVFIPAKHIQSSVSDKIHWYNRSIQKHRYLNIFSRSLKNTCRQWNLPFLSNADTRCIFQIC